MTRLLVLSALSGVVLASCAAMGLRGTDEVAGVEFGDSPERQAASFINEVCKPSGYPVVRFEVHPRETLLRCGAFSRVVYTRRAN